VRDKPLVRHLAEQACLSSASHIAVVLGAHAEAIAPVLHALDHCDESSLDILINPQWQEGMASSVRIAVAWAEALPCAGIVLTVVDQVGLTPVHIDQLAQRGCAHHAQVASAYAGVLGVPAFFPRASFPRLLKLTGRRGAAHLLRFDRTTQSIPWPPGTQDIDTPADLALLPR
jgi:CTP:molybdopterin cytidylyltransferase MocA